MISDEAIEKRMHELRETAAKYAKAYAERQHLEDYKHSLLAILMKRYETEGHKTAAAQEREARADVEYRDHLFALKDANEQAERLRWELKFAEMSIDIYRTREASKRAERKGYGA